MREFTSVWFRFKCLVCCLLITAGINKVCLAAEPIKITCALDWFPQPELGGFYAALIKGYYRDAGLDVTLLPGGPQDFPIQRVAILRAEFGVANSDNLAVAVQQKLPVLCVAAYLQHSPLGIMLHDSSPVQSFADLEGTTMGVPAGSTWYALLLKKYGFKNIQQQNFYSPSYFLTSPKFIQQAMLTSQPYFVEKKGAKVRFLLVKDLGYDPYGVLFVNTRFSKANPIATRAFVQASLRGWVDYLKDPEPVHLYLQKENQQLEMEWMNYSHAKLMEHTFVTGKSTDGEKLGFFDFARLEKEFKILRDLGLLGSELKVSDVFTNEFLENP